jgi:uncharacterized spore protein YtfJ
MRRIKGFLASLAIVAVALGTSHLKARARVGFGFGVGSGCGGYYGGGPYFGFDTYPSREVVYVNSGSTKDIELERENAQLLKMAKKRREEVKALEEKSKKQEKQQKKEVERLEKMIKRLEKKLKD